MFESLEAYAQQLVEFVRIHEAWSASLRSHSLNLRKTAPKTLE
jgi:hypothetical protein